MLCTKSFAATETTGADALRNQIMCHRCDTWLTMSSPIADPHCKIYSMHTVLHTEACFSWTINALLIAVVNSAAACFLDLALAKNPSIIWIYLWKIIDIYYILNTVCPKIDSWMTHIVQQANPRSTHRSGIIRPGSQREGLLKNNLSFMNSTSLENWSSLFIWWVMWWVKGLHRIDS